MGLKVVGAGLPRTGTTSLKAALEQLLGEPCYHMFEVFDNTDHGAYWWAALDGDLEALGKALDGYGAAIDWPASLFWRELHAENPDALVVLSHRGDAQTWWNSVDKTVWASMRRPEIEKPFDHFNQKMRAKAGLGDDWDTADGAMALYHGVYAEVTATVPPKQLVIWQASQGWEPLCEALGVAVPEQDFFHRNTTAEFRDLAGLDDH
jgi:hypothetical protein